jgi:hypothetical protein
MMTFTRFYKDNLPAWITDGEGGLVVGSICTLLDAAVERCRQGLSARFPSYAPADALPWIGRDRKIVRGINEPAAAYAARLIRWLDDHKVRGNPYALHAQLRAYLQQDVMIRTVDRRGNWFTTAVGGTKSCSLDTGNWDWDGGALSRWARFWVIIYPTAGGLPFTTCSSWATGLWASAGSFGTTATADQIASVRGIIKEWKPAGTRCEWIIIATDASSFTPTGSQTPGGDWGNWGLDTAGNYNLVRLITGRYWEGS